MNRIINNINECIRKAYEEENILIDYLPANEYFRRERNNASKLSKEIDRFCKKYNYSNNFMNNEGFMIYCKSGNEIVAILNFLEQPKGENYFIHFVITRNDFKGKGLFSKMFEYLKNIAKKHNIKTISSVVHKNNQGSNNAHIKLGFNELKINDKDKNGYIYYLNR